MEIHIHDSDLDIQLVAEVVAALYLGNERLHGAAIGPIREIFGRILAADREHYLYLRDPDDPASFFGCGTAEGASDAMIEDGSTCRLYSVPVGECPNCKE